MKSMLDPLKEVLRSCLDDLGTRTPRELESGELSVNENVMQRTVQDQLVARRQKLEALFLDVLTTVLLEDERPVRVTITLQSASGSAVDVDAYDDMRVDLCGRALERITLCMELPQSVGEVLHHTRHRKRATLAHGSLPTHYALATNALDVYGSIASRELKHEGRKSLDAVLRPQLVELAEAIRGSAFVRDEMIKHGIYLDDVLNAIGEM